MCYYPRIFKNPKYKANKKNGGVIPAVLDERMMYIAAGCGECKECRKQKAREWQIRMLEDIKTNIDGKFITLTLSNESIRKINEMELTRTGKKIKISELEGYEKDNAIATKAVREFTNRWRKKHGKSIRHWLITELGHNGTENIHLHGIVWTKESYKEIKDRWQYGWIWPRETEIKNTYVNGKTVNYITKYITKKDNKNTTYKPVILTSAGIGGNYKYTMDAKKNEYREGKTNETYRTSTGHRIAMPKYWRNEIYTEEEREKLWVEKLDKEVRYVNGIEIEIKNGNMKEYYKVLKAAREENKELGYGKGEKKWELAEYEKERRKIMHKKRMQ